MAVVPPPPTRSKSDYTEIVSCSSSLSEEEGDRDDDGSGGSGGRTTGTRPPAVALCVAVAGLVTVVATAAAARHWLPPRGGGGGGGDSSTAQLLLQQLEETEATVATTKAAAVGAADDQHHPCRDVDWEEACERIGAAAGARRNRQRRRTAKTAEEDFLNDRDDPTVLYDEHCLRVYRLDLFGDTTFPYHANQLLRIGGNQTMCLFIQHGAKRDADAYFCSFRKLMKTQHYRPFQDILVIAPDFNYKSDGGVLLETDAFWNATKPWGDWRVGAESDPECCGNGAGSRGGGGRTISSFAVLDHMLSILTNKNLYPNLNKISYVGHSAGAQMVQRYAIMSQLAAKYDADPTVDVEFIVGNPSSYTYLDDRRWTYHCGECNCNHKNCTCDQDCTEPTELATPTMENDDEKHEWVCTDRRYNRWPYGIGSFSDDRHQIKYALQSLDDQDVVAEYRKRHVVYMVGENDTCNDALPTCEPDCWKREAFLPDVEWPCYRNHMDTRCPAMLQGQYRRQRGLQYKKYLKDVFHGQDTHVLHVIRGVGHNATAMFGSETALQELFD